MSKKLLLVLAPIAIALAIMGSVYVSVYADGPRTTAAIVQNLGDSNATVRLDYYDPNGNLVVYTQTTVAPASALGFGANNQSGLTDGFVGSLVVSADQNIAAVGNDNDNDDIDYFSAVSDGATKVYVPALYKGFGNWQSEIWIQATEAVPSGAQATITFSDRNGQQTGTPKTVNLTTYASVKVTPNTYSDIPSGWAGGAVINSSYKMAIVVKKVRPASVGGVGEMYNGFSQGSSKVYVPSIFRKYGNWDSNGINIQNISATSATVSIDFYNRSGTKVGTYTFPNQFAPNGGVQAVNTKNISFLSDGYAGTAVIYSAGGQEIIAVVDQTSEAIGMGGAYNAVLEQEGALTAYVPAAFKRFGGWRTGVMAMNIGSGGSTVVTYKYYARGASTPSAVVTGTVGQYIAYAMNSMNAGLPDNWSGTVVVESSAEPVVVVANIEGGFSLSNPSQNAGKVGVYNAFPKKP
jgi:hypothetical protein